jgi:hypothetical protein
VATDERTDKAAGNEAHFGAWRRRLYRQATERKRGTAIVFRIGLQVFVPFAQKDARLAWGANQGAIHFLESLEIKA